MKKTLLHSLIAVFAAILFTSSAFAQPRIKSGTYTVAAGSTLNVQLTDLSFVTINSIGSAIDTLNYVGVEAGGTVQFNFASGYTETSTNNLAGGLARGNYSIGGAGSALFNTAYTQVIFKHNGTGAKPVLTANTNGTNASSTDYIIRLLGADNITFDGIDLQESSAHVSSNTTMEYGYYILNSSGNGCQNNTIKNCKISLYNYGASAVFLNSASIGIVQINTDATTTNSGSIFANDTITKAYAGGIRIRGISNTQPDAGIQIYNCVIGSASVGDIGSSNSSQATGLSVIGIEATAISGVTIYNNIVQNLQYYRTGTSALVYGIWVEGDGNNSIYKNQVVRIINKRTSASTGNSTAGLQINLVSTGTADVYNNFFGAIQLAGGNSSTSALYGIRSGSSSFSPAGTLNFYHNTVYLPAVSGEQLGSSANIYIYQGGSASVKIVNNILKNTISGIGGSSKTYCIYLGSGNSFVIPMASSSNYNILDITPDATRYFTGNYQGADRSSFVTWKASGTGIDANSKQFSALLVSTTNLHLQLSITAGDPNYTGTSISSPSITTDIDAEPRLYPHIGADEIVYVSTPQVQISANHPSDSLVALSTFTNHLAGIAFNVSGVDNILTSLTFSTSGTYSAVAPVDFKTLALWYSASSTFSPATSTLVDSTTYAVTVPAAGAGNITFSSLSISLPKGTTYIYLSFNVPVNAKPGDSIRIGNTTFSASNFSVPSTVIVGSPTVPYGGLQTIAQYYYNDADKDFTDELTWHEKTTGGPPSNFTDNNQVFVFIRNTGPYMGWVTSKTSWNVSGANTKIIVGDTALVPSQVIVQAMLPIVTGSGVVMDINNKGWVKFGSSSIPTALGTLSLGTASLDGSTVEYGDTTVTVTNQTIKAASYCNLILSGTTTGGALRKLESNISVSRSFITGGFPGATYGVVTFNGGIVTQTIPSGYIFRGLRTNNSVGATILAGNVQVDSSLRFTTNLNVTAGQTLTLGSSAIVAAPTVGGGILNITGAGAALTNNNPLTTTFAGTAATLNPYIVFGAGGTYNLAGTLSSTANNYGQIPPATWDATSTINITNVTSAGANNMVIGYPASNNFGNITFDAPGLTADYRLFGGINNTNNPGIGSYATPFIVNLAGNLTLGRTNGFTVDLGAGTAAQSCSTYVKKLIQSDGIYRLINSASGTNQKSELFTSDDITLSSGTQLILNGATTTSSNVRGILNVGANFTANAGTTVTELGTSTNNNIIFTKAGTQVLTTNGANFNNDINYIINGTSTTQLGTSSNLTVNTGAYMYVYNPGIFNIAAGNTLTINGLVNTPPTTGTFSGTSTSNLLIGGTAAGSVGTIYFTSGAAVLNNFSINRGVAATPSVTVGGTTGLTVHGTLTIGSGTNTNNIMDLGVNQLLAGGSFATNISATGTLRTQNTTATPIPAGYTWGGTVMYNSTIASQTIVNGNYNYLNGTGNARTLSSSGTIGVAGAAPTVAFIPGSGAYTVTNSTVDFNGSSAAQTCINTPFTFYNVGYKNGGTKTIGDTTFVRSVLTLDGASTTLELANKNIVMRSVSTLTSSVAPITTGTISYSSTGRFVIERNTGNLRSWRLLTAPISTSQTIKNAWMENSTNVLTGAVNPTLPPYDMVDGYGTHISGPLGNGFDQTPLNNYSIKYYDRVPPAGSRTWTGAGNTPVTPATDITREQGWMLFVRGDRNYGILTTTAGTSPIVTTLRTTGQIKTGTQTAINPSGFEVVGNPYASAVNFSDVNKSLVTAGGDIFYVWDPRYNGTLGGWIMLTRASGTSYTAVPSPVSPIDLTTGRIESGQAIMVNSANISSLQFEEADKTSANALVFRPSGNNTTASSWLRTNLYVKNNDGSTEIIDGVMNMFDKKHNTSVDGADGVKLTNNGENFSLLKDNTKLTLDRRDELSEKDTIFYDFSQVKVRDYILEFDARSMTRNNLVGYLEDKFLKTKTRINSNGNTRIEFDANRENPGSYAKDRFRIVFKKAVKYNLIKADVQASDVLVEWKVADEFNISKYEVERSLDGENFSTIAVKQSAFGKEAEAGYSQLDEKLTAGEYYYRIKTVTDLDMEVYSEVVKVKIIRPSSLPYVFPNPVTNNSIQLQLTDSKAGKYNVRLLNSNGQFISSQVIAHAGGTATQSITPAQVLTSGTYQLEVIGPDKKRSIIKVMVSNK